MVFVACGLNHQTTPLDLREQVALSASSQEKLLKRLVNSEYVQEAAILSTCNRTEIYCDTEKPTSLIPWLAEEHHIAPKQLHPHCYLHEGREAMRHTLRVASGLDSMMLGEPQILGQMKQAYQQACHAGTAKEHLRHLFPYVFRVSKRIRTHSGIGKNPISIAYAAALRITDIFKNLSNLTAFIIGSGETATLVAKHLAKAGVQQFLVASRTLEHGQLLAKNIDADTLVLPITDLGKHLFKADVVISATSCPIPFINQSLVQDALHLRQEAPMFFLDLAVPRDIEANISELPNVYLCNIDDLKTVVDKNRDKRIIAAEKAEILIQEELADYTSLHRARKTNYIISQYRSHMECLAHQELQRAQRKLSAGACQQDVLEEFSQRLLQKLTHRPTLGLRQVAQAKRDDLFDLAQYLFEVPS